ncbi:S-adenosylmethionine tRNA ribosyltransferase [Porphyromonas macacae]|uniref:S-adenosylmethionine tRNA ribosyltransferase n=1 Tax=Porphyromonas macacae TaxID=28115 RepID=A0A0A2E0S2_9PORP|nr:S-adenosylmethionine:tRNA ribosyltransferase-isomerase [Porphyromonas macacae]KGN72508.1 S-adenosylmethionine tRNA ribosyltransferase [Porphyromonas macacae]
MIKTTDIVMQDYAYDLPDERIAKYPLPERDSSKLLLYKHGKITETVFRNLPSHLPPKTLLVRNNTRVIRARLFFRKPTGARIEIFCLDPVLPGSYETALSARKECVWHCMLGNAKRWTVNSEPLVKEIPTDKGPLALSAKRICENQVAFSWDDNTFTFGELLESMGILPIPPYLNRDTEPADLKTYQTVYARHKGSVAAPTAGLHFTEAVFADLAKSDIPIMDVTLHVGAGTFKPVKSETIGGHEMHREIIIVDDKTLRCLNRSGRTVVAVGTTSVRTLESLYWLAVRILNNPDIQPEELIVTQWESYGRDENSLPSKKEAFAALLEWLENNELTQLIFPTEILIAPGYRFRVVEAIITNFHQPNSTLLLLIGAFIGNDWQRVYRYALEHSFRFLSYGDSSLLIP